MWLVTDDYGYSCVKREAPFYAPCQIRTIEVNSLCEVLMSKGLFIS